MSESSRDLWARLGELDEVGFEENKPRGWIQWKGTNVCMDLHCECGHHGHFDGDFFYFYECPACKKVYALGSNVKLIPLSEPDTKEVRESGNFVSIQTCELED